MAAHIQPVPLLGPVPAPPPGHSWEALMDMALEEARQAAAEREVPVGAVVVDNAGHILARARNASLRRHDPTAHAEILALRRAGAALGNYRLERCVLVATLEPCLMCTGALVHARVGGVVFGAADRKAGAIISCLEGLDQPFHNHVPWHMGGIKADVCATILRKFFGRPFAADNCDDF